MDMKELYIAANLLDAALCTVEDHPELASLQLKIVAAVHEIEAVVGHRSPEYVGITGITWELSGNRYKSGG